MRSSHTNESVHPGLLVILVVAVDASIRQWITFTTLLGLFERTQVVPLSWFTRAEVDMDSGGKFLKRIEWFLDQHELGNVVLAHTDRNHKSLPDRTPVELAPVEYMSCPLGHLVGRSKQREGRTMRSIAGKLVTMHNENHNHPAAVDYLLERYRKAAEQEG